MRRKTTQLFCTLLLALVLSISIGKAETVGVFFDETNEQIKFAAGEIKTALEAKSFTVEMLPLTSLNANYTNKKVVIALASDNSTTGILTGQGGTIPTDLGLQAYGLRTTTAPQTSYWVLGGDANGTMYGGFQIAENINLNAYAGTYNNQEKPSIVRRGIKLNLPFDKVAGTYGNANATSKVNAIPNVWDITFWQKWFDTMARNRFNVISVWSNHPFTSFVKVAGYENCAIQNVTGVEGNLIKTMTIDQKIVFWKEVMKYAHDRGFEFYLFNWNLMLDNADGKYGISEGVGKVTLQANIDYMRKSMTTLWETYPDLDGFGITQGESMSGNDADDAKFLGITYGQGTLDYAKLHPERTIRIIHRWHLTDFTAIKANFGELMNLPNINFEMSYKHSLAHMYSLALPDRMPQEDKDALVREGLKSHLTVRNDDFFYHNWGDPNYARDYVNGMIKRGTEGTGNTGNWLAGFYIGSDSYSPTRTFFSKNSVTQGMLEIDRQWYMNMLWGRLSYNPNTSDEVIKNIMGLKIPSVSSTDLFNAWQKCSKPFTDLGELICGTMGRDNQWWPEACQAIGPDQTVGKISAFLTIDDFAAASPMKSSTLASIAATAAGAQGGKNAFTVANEMETNASTALSFANGITADQNTELGVTLNNIKAMSYLSIYYAYKIRGAIYKKQAKTTEARDAMGTAYCWWIKYTSLMHANFTGMNLARSAQFPNWQSNDASALKEYTDLGGVGIPGCFDMNYQVSVSANDANRGIVKGAGTFKSGDNATAIAVSNQGYKFSNWLENGVEVSKADTFRFVVTKDRFLTANFINTTACDIPWSNTGFSVSNANVQRPFGPIGISCAKNGVTISFSVESVGSLETADFCKGYYKLDGGEPVLIGETYGNTTLRTFTVNNVVGGTIELQFNVINSAASETYLIKNISVTEGTTSLDKLTAAGISIYPNPVSQVLNIRFTDNQTDRIVRIFNSIGQLIFNNKTNDSKMEIDILKLNAKGLLMVQIETNNTIFNTKVIAN